MLAFEGLGPKRQLLVQTLDGEQVAIPLYEDITPNEELEGAELQDRYDAQGGVKTLTNAVLYRLEVCAFFLTSRTGRAWTVDEVRRRFSSKTTKQIFAAFQSEIQASLREDAVGETGTAPNGSPSGMPYSGDSSTISPEIPASAPNDSAISPSASSAVPSAPP